MLAQMTDLDESNRQFIDAWSMYARRAASGVVADQDGLAVAYSRVAMPLLNMLFVSSPVADSADLQRRIDAALAYGHAAGLPWMLTACDDWLPADAPAQLAAAGLVPASLATGMVTTKLAAPRRAVELDIRRAEDSAGRRAVADLNTAAYGMPTEWGHEAFDREGLFDQGDFWAYVGYQGGTPVSTSTTALVDGRLYVMLVATAADQQKKGYGEAVMRRSLEEAQRATGVTRTVLHATEMGAPLYTAMGYKPVCGFTMYALGGHD